MFQPFGSASITTDLTGVKAGEMRYKPFGEYRVDTGDVKGNKRFQGSKRVSSIELDSMGARFYSAGFGRFISADTIVPGAGNPQNFNRYSFVLNNPLKLIDPTGHGCQVPAGPGQNLTNLDPMACAQMGWGWSSGGSGGGGGASGFWNSIWQFFAKLILPDNALRGIKIDNESASDKGVRPPKAPLISTLPTDDDLWESAIQGAGGLGNDTEASLRFHYLDSSAVPKIMSSYGGTVGKQSTIPPGFSSNRVTTIGRLAQTIPAGASGERIIQPPNGIWTEQYNQSWIADSISNKDIFHLVTDVASAQSSLLGDPKYGGISVYSRELDQILNAGYMRVGDYLVPTR